MLQMWTCIPSRPAKRASGIAQLKTCIKNKQHNISLAQLKTCTNDFAVIGYAKVESAVWW